MPKGRGEEVGFFGKAAAVILTVSGGGLQILMAPWVGASICPDLPKDEQWLFGFLVIGLSAMLVALLVVHVCVSEAWNRENEGE